MNMQTKYKIVIQLVQLHAFPDTGGLGAHVRLGGRGQRRRGGRGQRGGPGRRPSGFFGDTNEAHAEGLITEQVKRRYGSDGPQPVGLPLARAL
jgi:hypothetical protein